MKIKGDKTALTPEIIERLKARKPELIEYLWPTTPKPAAPEKGEMCPAGDRTCRACATYEDREGFYCAYEAVFNQKGRRPMRVRSGSVCPRSDNHFGESRESRDF